MHLPSFSPIGGESIYSLVARHFHLSGHYSYTEYLSWLFGSSRTRIHPYIPSGIQAVASGLDIAAETLLTEHTLFCLFSLSLRNSEDLRESMLSTKSNSVATAHIPHFKLHFHAGHKYCPACVSEDINKTGCGVWYIEHQIPGISACARHNCYLSGQSNQDGSIDRLLVLPTKTTPLITANEPELLLSQYACSLHRRLCSRTRNTKNTLGLYRGHLGNKGLITESGYLRYSETIVRLKDYWRELSFGSTLGPPEALKTFKFIGPLLRNKTSSSAHPIKHILLSAWLFNGNCSAYFNNPVAIKSKPRKNINSTKDGSDKRIMALLKEGESMESIYSKTARSRCYIRRLAELNNIKHASNSNRYSNAQRHLVLLLAILGRHRFIIAKMAGVGRGYVELIICNTRGLAAWRKRLKKERRLISSAKEIREASIENPEWRRKEIKNKHSKAFFFLYHHDRLLLDSILPKKTPPKAPVRDWSDEDRRLIKAILNIENARNLSLSAIARLVNDRGHLRKQIHNLPDTRALLIKLGKV